MGFDPRDVCFVGLGNSAQAYYRVALPATELGCDWCGVYGEPPKLHWATGMVGNNSVMPVLGEYKIVVLQQVCGKGWEELVEMLQDRGVIVVWETDDYVHGIKHMKGEHDYYDHFDNKTLSEMESMMKKCDAIIGSTPWITGNYSHFNKRTYVCRNGIDPARYDLTLPKRDTINIGWAGGTGHKKVVIPWFQEAAKVMRERDDVCFVSIGEQFALAFQRWFGAGRALSVPWAAIEQYPAAMTLFDIALAPGGDGGFWWGKSDLRWLESSALGIPLIAHPVIYKEIEHGETGYKVSTPKEAGLYMSMLVRDGSLRKNLGAKAKDFVLNNRTISHTAGDWKAVFEDLLKPAE